MSTDDITRTAKGVADTLANIDAGTLGATPAQRAFLAGVLHALRAVVGQTELDF